MSNLSSSAPHVHGAVTYEDLADWGVQADALAGVSRSTGRLLHTGAAGSCLILIIFGSGTIPDVSQGGEPC